MDERKATERGGWLDPGGPQHISDDEVEAGLALFLNAAKRAQDTLASRSAPAAGGRRRWARRVLAAGSVALLGPLVKPVEATPFAGLQGTVTSLEDQRPVPGVLFYRVGTVGTTLLSGGRGGGCSAHAAQQAALSTAIPRAFLQESTPVAITDAMGRYEIPPDENAASTTYVLVHGGREAGRFIVDKDVEETRGVKLIEIDAATGSNGSQQEVTLKPGETAACGESLRLALDPSAPAVWQGRLVDDKRWPSNFIFNQVLAGIASVEGPPSTALRMSVFISSDVLRLFDAQPADIRLVAYSHQYYIDDSKTWRSASHRGWYLAGNPPHPYLPKKELAFETAAATGQDGPAGVWASWQADTGVPYALLVKPNLQGEATVVWYNSLGEDGMQTNKPGVRLINRNRLQASLYDVDYYDPETKQTYTLEQFPYRPQRESWFFDGTDTEHGMEPRGMFGSNFWFPIVKPLEAGSIPGSFTLRLMDSTVDNCKEWPGITYMNHTQPGSYDIEFGPIQLGCPVPVKLTGDVDRLACAPDWDFYSDNVIDRFKAWETAFTPLHAGSYSICAVLREKDGKVVLVDRRLLLPVPGALGYKRYDMSDILVCAGLAQPKPQRSSIRVLSPCAVASPSAFGYTSSQKLGPSLYIELPENMCNTPLKESRTYIFVRAVGGENAERDETAYLRDSCRMYLEPTNSWGELQRDYYLSLDKSKLQFPWASNDKERISGDCGHSWYIYLALHDSEYSDPAQALAFLMELNDTPVARDRFKAFTGIDLDHPPAADEFVAQLRDYAASPYFNVKFATPELAEMQWNVKLFGVSIPSGNGMIAEIHINDNNIPMAGQWEVYSGGDCPSRVEIEAENGEKVVRYFDYSPLAAPAPVRLAAGGG